MHEKLFLVWCDLHPSDEFMSLAILGLGTAVPDTIIDQSDASRIAQSLAGTTPELGSWLTALYDGTAIRTRYTSLGPVVVRLINQQLASETLPEDSHGKLDSSSVQLARTASRSVLGYMNETATYCSYAIADYGGLERCDIAALNRELRRELHMSRRPPGYFVPIDEVIKRVGVSRRPDLGIVN